MAGVTIYICVLVISSITYTYIDNICVYIYICTVYTYMSLCIYIYTVYICTHKQYWLVVSTPLKNISQLGLFSIWEK